MHLDLSRYVNIYRVIWIKTPYPEKNKTARSRMVLPSNTSFLILLHTHMTHIYVSFNKGGNRESQLYALRPMF